MDELLKMIEAIKQSFSDIKEHCEIEIEALDEFQNAAKELMRKRNVSETARSK